MANNRFDQAAATWDEKPRRVALSAAIATAIETAIPLKQSMVGLEYGCGTGLVTFAIAKHIGEMVGLDNSTGMITVMEEKKKVYGVTNVSPFHGAMANLDRPPLNLIIISMTLHHIEREQELLASFYKNLQPGGFLAIADLEAEDGSFHKDLGTVPHNGFDPQRLSHSLRSLGFAGIHGETIYTVEKNKKRYPIFLLTSRRV